MDEVWADDKLLDQTRNGIELWRAVVGADGWYDVSNFGRVRSWIDSHRKRARLACPSLMSPSPQTDGYLAVTLAIGNKQTCKIVSALMAESFIGQRPKPCIQWEAAHFDGVKTNNVLTNIRWATRSQNSLDKRRHGKDQARASVVIDTQKCYQCTGCSKWLPVSSFRSLSKRSRSRCGISSQCRDCSRVRGNELKRLSRQRATTEDTP